MRIDVQQVKAAARGRWLSIFEILGIEVPAPPGAHGPCPVCLGTDRFRLDQDTADGTWFCNQCTPQAGDGISLVRECLGLGFHATLTKISEIVGSGVAQAGVKKESSYDPKEMLNKVWSASVPIAGADPVSKYLHSRGILLTPENVRYCSECYNSDTKAKYPAMVARLMDPEGKPVGLHRTYLADGKKADVKSPKKLMKGVKPLAGSAVRLCKPDNGAVGIAEGVETAMAARQVSGVPCWAALNTSLLKTFRPPDGIRHVVIFGDVDPHFAGHVAAYSLANRLYNMDLLVQVEFPPEGKDWNDYLILLNKKQNGDVK